MKESKINTGMIVIMFFITILFTMPFILPYVADDYNDLEITLSGDYDIDDYINISLVFEEDISTPKINLTYPTNITYPTNTLNLNYIYIDSNCESAWWNNGTDNSSLVTCGINWTGLTANEGSNVWKVYVNNTYGLESYDEIAFSVDTTSPVVTVLLPDGTYNRTYNITMNWSYSDVNSCSDSVYSLNDGANVTTNCGNATFSGANEHYNTIMVCANDSMNNWGCTEKVFYVDTWSPDTLIIYPRETEFDRESVVNISSICKHLNGSYCSPTTYCRLTVHYPNRTLLGEDLFMQSHANGVYNYSLGTLATTGEYDSSISCYDILNGTVSFHFDVGSSASEGEITIGGLNKIIRRIIKLIE